MTQMFRVYHTDARVSWYYVPYDLENWSKLSPKARRSLKELNYDTPS